MTLYEEIKKMSVDEMADFLYSNYEAVVRATGRTPSVEDREERINSFKELLLRED